MVMSFFVFLFAVFVGGLSAWKVRPATREHVDMLGDAAPHASHMGPTTLVRRPHSTIDRRVAMARPFENPSNLVRDPKGMTYGKATALAGGVIAIAYYVARRRDTRVLPSEDIKADVLRPDRGTTQQVGTNRQQQQHRKVPPSKKETVDERT